MFVTNFFTKSVLFRSAIFLISIYVFFYQQQIAIIEKQINNATGNDGFEILSKTNKTSDHSDFTKSVNLSEG